MSEIIDEILKQVSKDKISDAVFEGANIVLYTKDKDFFLDNKGLIKKVVDDIKKRVELRPDPSISMDMEDAKDEIKKIIPEEANVGEIIFDSQRSRVIIHAEKPGVAIGKKGESLREIREKTMWVPLIRRTAAIKSKLVDSIRAVLYAQNDYRRKFLHKQGKRIYDGWLRGKKEEWVRLTYLGSGRHVGRSCIFLQTPESRILMDCGIDPSGTTPGTTYPLLECPEFRIQELDAVIISHAHLDHTGFLPYLFKLGYRGPVYCTAPTRDVMSMLQLDYMKIMRMEQGESIYTSEEVKEMVKHTICLDIGEVTDITPDVRITLYNAGHILGSAQVHLHIGNGLHNIVYSGDMKFGRTELLDTADTKFPRVETLLLESTYGGKENILPSRESEEKKISEIVNSTIEKKGKVLLPVLGVGRAQEILLILEKLMRNKKIPEVTVYLDGMVWDVNAIHTAYPEFLNSNVRKLIFHADSNPFLRECFKQVGSVKERKKVIEDEGSCIIMATSGMLVGGSSVEYLRHLADNPKNAMIFNCYQAGGTLGRRVQSGEKDFVVKSGQKQELVPVKLRVETVEGFTGHSDRNQLMNYIRRCNPRPRKVIVNHGESSRCINLASGIHKTFRIETAAPKNLEAIRLV